jgi:hypothetical protein
MPVGSGEGCEMPGPEIRFLFESADDGDYVKPLANSALLSGSLVTQNAGSTNSGFYYLVDGGGLNGAFKAALGAQRGAVNAELKKAYDAKFGAGKWARDAARPPSEPPLTSLLIPISPTTQVGDRVVGMVYSVGPMLTSAGLSSSMQAVYTQIYRDAMDEIAASPTRVDAFRITMLSSGIYRGNAPIGPFADAAAACIVEAVVAAVQADPETLGDLTILINTKRTATPPIELDGFTHAAAALGVAVTDSGFWVSPT